MFTKLTICRVGKATSEYNAVEQHYTKLITSKIEIKVIPHASYLSPNEQVINESKHLTNLTLPKSFIICLDSSGKKIDSVSFAALLQSWSEDYKNIFFAIGGSHGLSDEIKAKSNYLFSLSTMTFPHQLAHVILLEQIYRAETIIAGRAYHK